MSNDYHEDTLMHQEEAKYRMQLAPTATTTKGVVLANLCSPNAFTFNDGTMLGKCDGERVRRGALEPIQNKAPGIKGTMDVWTTYELTKSLIEMLDETDEDDEIDIVIVDQILMECIEENDIDDIYPKCRTVLFDPQDPRLAYHDRFCK